MPTPRPPSTENHSEWKQIESTHEADDQRERGAVAERVRESGPVRNMTVSLHFEGIPPQTAPVIDQQHMGHGRGQSDDEEDESSEWEGLTRREGPEQRNAHPHEELGHALARVLDRGLHRPGVGLRLKPIMDTRPVTPTRHG